jgi:hypothetical protein
MSAIMVVWLAIFVSGDAWRLHRESVTQRRSHD